MLLVEMDRESRLNALSERMANEILELCEVSGVSEVYGGGGSVQS